MNDEPLAARIGFTIEWASALQEGLLRLVAERVPELRARWPLQGFNFEAMSDGQSMVLVLRVLPVAAVTAGPSEPTPLNANDLPLPVDSERFPDWEVAFRERHGLASTDLIAIVPVPDDVASNDCPRPHAQWEHWTEAQQQMWQMAIRVGLMRGVQSLASTPVAADEVSVSSAAPIKSRVYKENPPFVPPGNLDQPIWRYMSLAKYLSLLESQTLHFARADMLGDPWEGARGLVNASIAHELYGESADEIHRALSDARLRPYISCWHAQEGESAAMWSIYAGQDPLRTEGVAVRSTFRHLLESLDGPDDVHAGMVQYHDYDHDFVPEDNAFSPYLHKRPSFEHERELRSVISRAQADDGAFGIAVPVDLRVMVTEVRVAPLAPTWFRDLIRSVTTQYGMEYPVEQSAMDAPP